MYHLPNCSCHNVVTKTKIQNVSYIQSGFKNLNYTHKGKCLITLLLLNSLNIQMIEAEVYELLS